MTEKQLSECVRELAKLTGWMAYHTHRSQHSAAGFPDWVMLRNGRLLAIELKSDKGKTTYAQDAWLAAFEASRHRGAMVYVAVWRPRDWHSGRIERVLKHGPGKAP